MTNSLPRGGLVSGWKAMALLAVVAAVIGVVLVPQLLGARDEGSALTTASLVVGVGAALWFGSLSMGMLVRGPGAKPRPTPEAPPTIHSAPTVFEEDAPETEQGAQQQRRDEEAEPDRVPPPAWSTDLIASLEWQRFEALCAGYYRDKGIRHLAMSLAANGGMDIYLFQDELSPRRATAVVHARSRGVTDTGVQGVRELLGVMAHERIDRGFYMTNGGFTPEARTLGRHHNIVLIDARVLLAMIERLPEEQRARLLGEATAGAYTVPTCALCGSKMVVASGSHGDYWGCGGYPECRWMMPLSR